MLAITKLFLLIAIIFHHLTMIAWLATEQPFTVIILVIDAVVVAHGIIERSYWIMFGALVFTGLLTSVFFLILTASDIIANTVGTWSILLFCSVLLWVWIQFNFIPVMFGKGGS